MLDVTALVLALLLCGRAAWVLTTRPASPRGWLRDKPYPDQDGQMVPCGCGCGDAR